MIKDVGCHVVHLFSSGWASEVYLLTCYMHLLTLCTGQPAFTYSCNQIYKHSGLICIFILFFDWSIPKSNIALIDTQIPLVHNIAPYLYVYWFSAHLMAARPHQASIAEAGYLVRGVGNGNLNAYLYGWALVV